MAEEIVREILWTDSAKFTFNKIIDTILLSYMQMLEKPKGVLINFHCVNIFKEGQKTPVNNLFSLLPEE